MPVGVRGHAGSVAMSMQATYVGSPASLVALSVFAVIVTGAPRGIAAPKLSLAGAPRLRWTIRLPAALA
jgi:hypothetical protein